MTPLAHAGHWLVNLLYVAPVILLVGALALQSWRDRRNGVRSEEDDVTATPEPDGGLPTQNG